MFSPALSGNMAGCSPALTLVSLDILNKIAECDTLQESNPPCVSDCVVPRLFRLLHSHYLCLFRCIEGVSLIYL